jgi:CTP:molybdopterin cytidylyltransferase MocA
VTVAGLLLAAGGGRRFGGPKALAVYAGELLVERGVRLLEAGGCAPVLVVLGAGADQVRAGAHLGAAIVVFNERWATGMGSSLRAGLDALREDAQAVVVALVDQPLVTPAAVERLVHAWRAGAEAAVATYAGRPRNPVLLDRCLWAEVGARADGDAGARAFLRAHPDRVTPVPCDDVASSADVDTAADLAALP